MKTFLNVEMKQFKDLSDEEMGCIVRAKIEENAESFGAKDWIFAPGLYTNFEVIYRTKPAKQLVIPWQHLDKEIKFVVMNEDTRVYAHRDEPSLITLGVWAGTSYPISLDRILNIDTDGIDWETSLVERPEGV